MKNKFISLVLSLAMIFSAISIFQTVVSADEPSGNTVPTENSVKILCIGDSLTAGDTNTGAWRKELARLLHADERNLDFEFTGVNYDDVADMAPSDRWHCGHGGYSIGPDSSPQGNVDKEIVRYMNCDADIILLMLGRNEYVFADPTLTADKYYNLVEKIFEAKPNVKLFAATVPILRRMDSESADLVYSPSDPVINGINKDLPQIVASFRDKGKDMFMIDTHPDISGVTYDDYYSDRTHYNMNGYTKLGKVFYDRIADAVYALNQDPDAQLLNTYPSGIGDDVVPYDGEIQKYDFSNWKGYKNIIDNDNTKWTTSGTAGYDSQYYTWRTGNAYNAWNENSATLNDNGYISYPKFAMDLQISKFEFGAGCGNSSAMKYSIDLYRVNNNNRLSFEFTVHGNTSNYVGNGVATTINLVKVTNGVSETLETLESNSANGRIRLIVDGTKLSVAFNTAIWFRDLEIGTIPSDGYLRIASRAFVSFSRGMIYTPPVATATVKAAPVNYSINFRDYEGSGYNASNITGWTAENMTVQSWNNYQIETAAYGWSYLKYNDKLYSDDFIMDYNFRLHSIRNDTYQQEMHLYFGSGVQVFIQPRHASGNYMITLEQRTKGRVMYEYIYRGTGNMPTGEVNIHIENIKGLITVDMKIGNNTTRLFENIPLDVAAGRVEFNTVMADCLLRNVNIKAVLPGDATDDGNVDIKDLIRMKKAAALQDVTFADRYDVFSDTEFAANLVFIKNVLLDQQNVE